MRPLIVLVSGSREYTNGEMIDSYLSTIDEEFMIIEGGARGADRLCREWAIANDVLYTTVEADWKKYNKAAGHIRNQAMLDMAMSLSDNTVLIAFPLKESKGTYNMIGICQNAGMEVVVAPWRDTWNEED